MRKLFFLFVSFLATTCLWAYDFQSGDLYYRITSSDPYTVEVTSSPYHYSGLTIATIPETVTCDGITYSVTSIGEGAFDGCSSLTSVTIPNSVTSIGDWAFYYCSSLTSITIPNSVTSIGNSAFYRCSSLTSVTIPESVTSIGYWAFNDCSSLTSVTIGNSVTSIGESAFGSCSSITSVKWNAKNCSSAFSQSLFSDSKQHIISFTFGNNVEHIPESICKGMTLLTSVTIPNSVTSIGEYAFSDCSSLTSVTIGNSVTSIGEYAFYYCSSLTSVTIPNSVTSIGEYAFYYCSSLTSVTIPNSVTSIGESAFEGCSSLTSVTIPNSVTSIGEGAFAVCSSLTSVTIPNSVTSIGNAAFAGCSSLTSVTIPNSVTSIGDWAFYYCSSLTSITIPNSVTSIGNSAFYRCSSLTSITIPNSVTSIGDCAFVWCSSLTSVTIPNNVTNIGGGIFGRCENLQSVVLPKNITSLSRAMLDEYESYGFFTDCSSLTSITLNSTTPPSIGYKIFGGVDMSIPIYVPCGCVDAYRNSDWSIFSNIQEPPAEYSINLTINESKMGTAHVDKNNACGNQISATAHYGYHWAQWSDGNTDNPRSLELTQDTILTAEFAPNNYTLSIQSDNSERGTTSGDVTTTYLDYVTISATANYGYHFSHWDDYNYDNPRQVQVTEDKTYTAYFDKNTYYITKNYDSNQGYVDGYSSGEYLDNITLIAEPNYGYHFVRWSDGNTDNPRHFVLTQDTTFAAEFAQTFSGQCGDNLYWSYQNNTLTISGFGEMNDYRPWGLFTNEIQTVVLPNGMTHIGDYAFSDCTGLSEITIPYAVTSIGDYAFSDCTGLSEITIPNSVTSIGDGAFYNCEKLGTLVLGDKVKEIGEEAFNGCNKLYHIYCYAPEPPMAYESSFANYNVNLYVPCNYLNNYKYDRVFGSFKYIQCIESEDVTTDDVVVTPGTNDVTITWPTEGNADTYTIVIKKGDTVFCTLTFNAEGQLLNIAFAPGRDGNRPAQYAKQAGNGYRFTVTNLESGTKYGYNIDVKDASNKTIKSHSGEFTTQSTTAVEEVEVSDNANVQKTIHDGQLLILRNGKSYNVMGQEL